MTKKGFQITLEEELVDKLRIEYKGRASPLIEQLLFDYFSTLNKEEVTTEDKKEEVLSQKEKLEKELKEIEEEEIEKARELRLVQEKKEEKERVKIREISNSLIDFFVLDKDEAEGWARTFIDAKEQNPELDYWEFFNSKGFEERAEEVLENLEVEESEKEVEK